MGTHMGTLSVWVFCSEKRHFMSDLYDHRREDSWFDSTPRQWKNFSVQKLLLIFVVVMIGTNIFLVAELGKVALMANEFKSKFSQFEPFLAPLTSGVSSTGDVKKVMERSDDKYLLFFHSIYAMIVQSFERLHVVDAHDQALHQLSWDTSTNLEFSYIWQRMYSENCFPKEDNEKLVIDIGAMDGLSGSNAYNFIVHGWKGILIEPFPRHIERAEKNLAPWIDQDKVILHQGVVGEKDGETTLYFYNDASKTSNTIDPDTRHASKNDHPTGSLTVNSITVASLVEKYNIPNSFGVLTIDAEGVGEKILTQFMKLKMRPRYVIYEFSIGQDASMLSESNYKLVRKVYNNDIWEWQGCNNKSN